MGDTLFMDIFEDINERRAPPPYENRLNTCPPPYSVAISQDLNLPISKLFISKQCPKSTCLF